MGFIDFAADSFGEGFSVGAIAKTGNLYHEFPFTGEILERQKDRNTGEFKDRIRDSTLEGDSVEAVVKLGLTGKVVIITVYLL